MIPKGRSIHQRIGACIAITCVLLFSGFLQACAPDNTIVVTGPEQTEEVVKIVYVEWASEVASAHVVQAVIEEKLEQPCRLLPVSALAMWEAVAAGDQDAMVAAWLPSLHREYYETHKHQVESLGPNLENAVMGLVVPEYVDVDTIEDLHAHETAFGSRIIGIDPGAGIMRRSEEMLEQYQLTGFQLVPGSDATMTGALEKAIQNKEWIVVTGWTPHWKFARWPLKYLEDPLNVYGTGEEIHTIVRKGLAEDNPDVYRFLDRFYWESEQMEQVMLWIEEESIPPPEAARKWVKENDDQVQRWIEP